jgi:hypothetical protein
MECETALSWRDAPLNARPKALRKSDESLLFGPEVPQDECAGGFQPRDDRLERERADRLAAAVNDWKVFHEMGAHHRFTLVKPGTTRICPRTTCMTEPTGPPLLPLRSLAAQRR